MRHINDLDAKTIKELEIIIRDDNHYKSRYRSQAILLSNQGKSVNEISEIFGYKIRTVYRWSNHFELQGAEGLHDIEGRGRKATLRVEIHSKSVYESIKKLNLNEICAALKKAFPNQSINKRKLKQFFKKIGISYKRARRTIR